MQIQLYYPNKPKMMDSKIQLIKELRLAIGLGLTEAKEIIDYLQLNGSTSFSIMTNTMPNDLVHWLAENNISWQILNNNNVGYNQNEHFPMRLFWIAAPETSIFKFSTQINDFTQILHEASLKINGQQMPIHEANNLVQQLNIGRAIHFALYNFGLEKRLRDFCAVFNITCTCESDNDDDDDYFPEELTIDQILPF